MKSRFWLLVIGCLIPSAAFAEQVGVNPQVGLFGGGQFGNDELDSGAAVMGSIGLRLMPYFSIDVQGGWMPATSKQNKIADSDITLTSMEFIPRIYAPLGRFQPYIGAGAARFFIDEQIKSRNSVFASYNEDVQGTWGGVFGGGFELAINENMSLGVDVSYIYLRTDVQRDFALAAAPGAVIRQTDSLNLDTVRALAGIRIKFNSPGWSNVY